MESKQWSISEPQTIDVDEVVHVKARIVAGRVDVLVHEEKTTRVEVSGLDGQPMALGFSNGTLELKHPSSGIQGQGWLRGLTVTTKEKAVVSIAVPEGTTVELHTVSGDALACGTRDTRLDTVSGSVMADDTAGNLTINTVSGEAIVRHHTGTLATKSVSGEVTASGYLTSVRTNSVSGDTSLDLLGIPHNVAARTVSGDVAIRLVREVGVEIVSRSASGTVSVNDRKFAGMGRNTVSEPGTSDHLLRVEAHSVSGNVSIYHRDARSSSNPAIEHHDGTL